MYIHIQYIMEASKHSADYFCSLDTSEPYLWTFGSRLELGILLGILDNCQEVLQFLQLSFYSSSFFFDSFGFLFHSFSSFFHPFSSFCLFFSVIKKWILQGNFMLKYKALPYAMIIEPFFHISVLWIIETECHDPEVFLFTQNPKK